MAKKRGRPRGRKGGVPETVGATLGTVMAKVDAWVAQRQVLANELQQVIGRAQKVLASLGAATSLRSGARGRPTQNPPSVGPMQEMSMLTAGSGTRRKRRAMSAEAREKIAAAQRARWAKQKAGSAAGAIAAPTSAKKVRRGRKAKGKAKAAAANS
jgi:hypothetical protein